MRRHTRWVLVGLLALLLAGMLGRRTLRLGALRHALLPLSAAHPQVLLLAVALNTLAMLISGAVWTRLARYLGHPVSLRIGLLAYLSAGLGGYLLSVAGPLVGAAVPLRRHGLCPGRAVLLVALANAIGFCGVLLWTPLGLLALAHRGPWQLVPLVGRYGLGVTACLLGGLALGMLALLRLLAAAPATDHWLVRRVLGPEPLQGGEPLRLRRLLALVPWCAAAWLAGALALAAVLGSLSHAAAHQPTTIIGAAALCGVLGALAFFVPEGIGVREGLLVALLAHSIGLQVGQGVVAVVALRALDPLIKVTLLLLLVGAGSWWRPGGLLAVPSEPALDGPVPGRPQDSRAA